MLNRIPFLRSEVDKAPSGPTAADLAIENAELKRQLNDRTKADAAVTQLTALGLTEKQARKTIASQTAFEHAKAERAAAKKAAKR